MTHTRRFPAGIIRMIFMGKDGENFLVQSEGISLTGITVRKNRVGVLVG